MLEIAIAVRDTDLFLIATVVRKGSTDVYVNWPRDHVVGWKPHSSYHASGQHHQKSFGYKAAVQQKQKPDAAFVGNANVVRFGLASGEHKVLNLTCDPNDFGGVFEISVGELRPERYRTYVDVDLIEPGVDPATLPVGKVLRQEIYKDGEPWIVVSLSVSLG
jgi:hypothetical protein